ncbi:MAG: SEC-C metal-binding domain-containing protein [Clostridia bacterium]|nr:SEC-C metal-binding domain-containing protein [Clostridia bacterium]
MDVISQGDFAISNFEGVTILNFRLPSISHTDFVQNLKSLEPRKSGFRQGRNEQCLCGSGKKYKNCCGKFQK